MVEQVFEQYADPLITKAKFEIELDRFFDQYSQWQKKGVFLTCEEFPVCEFLFLAPRTFPISPVFAVRIDFTNYDAEPLSVKFINPFTGQLVKKEQIPLQFKQKASREYIEQKKPRDPSQGMDVCVSILGDYPFICHPGFREYHNHPYHTGDSWLLRRAQGEGRLYRILQVLYDHSTALVESMSFQQTGRKELQLSFVQKKP